jgi:predicted HTH transcriptional regulator
VRVLNSPDNSNELREVKKLATRGEGLHIEFKRKANHPDKIAKEFVAFANATGGVLLLGVDDDGTVAGVKHAEGDLHVIREALKKSKPPLLYTEKTIPLSGTKSIVWYTVPESKTKPHHLTEADGAHAYVRVHDKCLKASKQLCEVLKRSSKQKNIQFVYGEQEKLLMQYLEVHNTISLSECETLLKINTWKASRKLVLLVLAGVLEITPTEKGDLYSRK